ncbi:MAG TPA: hypothetical protein VKT70_11220 [Stellaceae bacterium]|nr:hypothetical protein [Stellaceae bacterium]
MTRRARLSLIAGGGLLLLAVVAAVLYLLFSRITSDTDKPRPFTDAAQGYSGVVDLLQRLGIDAEASRENSLDKVRPGGLLVICDPVWALDTVDTWSKFRNTLVILPKWYADESWGHWGWVKRMGLTRRNFDYEFKSLGFKGTVVGIPVERTIPITRDWPSPITEKNFQLLKSQDLTPIIATGEGMLLGLITRGEGANRRRLFILSDPDTVNNLGMKNPANAEFAVKLFTELVSDGGNIVFDNGNPVPPAPVKREPWSNDDGDPDPWLVLFRFPMIILTIEGAIALALLLLATMKRFGAAVRAPDDFSSDKSSLIQNAGRLLIFGRHEKTMVIRYIQAVLQDVARKLRAPAGLGQTELASWLRQAGLARGISADGFQGYERAMRVMVEGEADRASLLALAQDIHRWKREMIHGSH